MSFITLRFSLRLFQYISHPKSRKYAWDVQSVTVYSLFLLFISCYVVTLCFIVSYNIYLSRLDIWERRDFSGDWRRRAKKPFMLLASLRFSRYGSYFLVPCFLIVSRIWSLENSPKILLDFIAFCFHCWKFMFCLS